MKAPYVTTKQLTWFYQNDFNNLKIDCRQIIALVVTISSNFLNEIMDNDIDNNDNNEELDMRIHLQLRGIQRKPARIVDYRTYNLTISSRTVQVAFSHDSCNI